MPELGEVEPPELRPRDGRGTPLLGAPACRSTGILAVLEGPWVGVVVALRGPLLVRLVAELLREVVPSLALAPERLPGSDVLP